jgi:hypothetical protein
MDPTSRVDVMERVRELPQQPSHDAVVQLPRPWAQASPLHERHHVEGTLAIETIGDELHDSRMVELKQDLDLALEPFASICIGCIPKQLDRNFLSGVRADRAPDFAEPTSTAVDPFLEFEIEQCLRHEATLRAKSRCYDP